MNFILIIGFVIIGGSILLTTSIYDTFFPNDSFKKEPSITINNYKTEQHLHISEDQAKELSKKK